MITKIFKGDIFGLVNKKVDSTDAIHRASFRVPSDKALELKKKI